MAGLPLTYKVRLRRVLHEERNACTSSAYELAVSGAEVTCQTVQPSRVFQLVEGSVVLFCTNEPDW